MRSTRAQIKDPEKVTNKMYGGNTDIPSHFFRIFNLRPSNTPSTLGLDRVRKALILPGVFVSAGGFSNNTSFYGYRTATCPRQEVPENLGGKQG